MGGNANSKVGSSRYPVNRSTGQKYDDPLVYTDDDTGIEVHIDWIDCEDVEDVVRPQVPPVKHVTGRVDGQSGEAKSSDTSVQGEGGVFMRGVRGLAGESRGLTFIKQMLTDDFIKQKIAGTEVKNVKADGRKYEPEKGMPIFPSFDAPMKAVSFQTDIDYGYKKSQKGENTEAIIENIAPGKQKAKKTKYEVETNTIQSQEYVAKELEKKKLETTQPTSIRSQKESWLVSDKTGGPQKEQTSEKKSLFRQNSVKKVIQGVKSEELVPSPGQIKLENTIDRMVDGFLEKISERMTRYNFVPSIAIFVKHQFRDSVLLLVIEVLNRYKEELYVQNNMQLNISIHFDPKGPAPTEVSLPNIKLDVKFYQKVETAEPQAMQGMTNLLELTRLDATKVCLY